MTALAAGFYDRDTLSVARDLLGCVVVHESPAGRAAGRIVEVEAYHGEDDPACHAAAGRTARTAPLYGPAGRAYVYRIYGMHFCLNAVTRVEGAPSAVLIRALEPLQGLDRMRERRERRRGGPVADARLADGPGKLCEALGVTLDHNRLDLAGPPLWIEPGKPPARIAWTPRVGISVGIDRHWRALETGSPWVSKSKWNRRTARKPRPALA